jgi:hypothetical protein
VDDFTAFEVFGQRRAAVFSAVGWWLLGGGHRRRGEPSSPQV